MGTCGSFHQNYPLRTEWCPLLFLPRANILPSFARRGPQRPVLEFSSAYQFLEYQKSKIKNQINIRKQANKVESPNDFAFEVFCLWGYVYLIFDF